MDKREQIARMAQTKEDEILLARVYERITSAAARNIPAATAFLSKREQMLAAELLRGQDFAFFGGPAMAEREVCCYVPEYLDESWLTGDEGPIAAVRAVYFAGDTLTHRDFLGALMGCGIKRETVGDIYVSEGSCDFLVTREILPYLLQNFLSAGRTKLHVEQLPIDQIRVPEQKVKAVRDTVSSLRLDGVVSSGFSISRGKAADYIAAGKCELNYAPCMKGDKQAAEGDVITIRGLARSGWRRSAAARKRAASRSKLQDFYKERYYEKGRHRAHQRACAQGKDRRPHAGGKRGAGKAPPGLHRFRRGRSAPAAGQYLYRRRQGQQAQAPSVTEQEI